VLAILVSLQTLIFVGLSEEMFDEGYQHITNIDISFTVVKQMQDHYREKYPTLTYKQMDVR